MLYSIEEKFIEVFGTVINKSRFQTVSSFQVCLIFFKGNFGMVLRMSTNTRSNSSYNLSFYYQYYPQLTHVPTQYHTSELLALYMASYQ